MFLLLSLIHIFLNEQLSKKWGEERGLQVVSFGINTMTLPDDQRKKLEEMQQAVILSLSLIHI